MYEFLPDLTQIYTPDFDILIDNDFDIKDSTTGVERKTGDAYPSVAPDPADVCKGVRIPNLRSFCFRFIF